MRRRLDLFALSDSSPDKILANPVSKGGFFARLSPLKQLETLKAVASDECLKTPIPAELFAALQAYDLFLFERRLYRGIKDHIPDLGRRRAVLGVTAEMLEVTACWWYIYQRKFLRPE